MSLADMTPTEVEAALLEGEISYPKIRWDSAARAYVPTGETTTENLEEVGWDIWDELERREVSHPLLGTVKVVQNVGGGEGAGETRYIVFRIEDESGVRFFQMNGYYMSYDGSHFDGPFVEVTPKQKTITVYEEV